MFIFLFSVSFLALIVFILLSVLGFIKKNGQGKKNLKIAGICFLVSFCSLIVEAIVNPVPMEINLKVTSEIPKRVESTQKSIKIKGQVEYADQLEVNGKSVKIEDNTFSTKVALKEGNNSIVIYASNEEFNQELKYEVIRANPPVNLEVSYDSHIEVPSYELKGTVLSGATVTLTKDDQTIGETIADENGAFSFSLDTKEEATYNYIVSATKKDFAEEKVEISITRTIPDVPLTVTYDSDIQVASYTINGTTEPGATVIITKDEKKIDQVTAGKDGDFSFKVNTKEPGDYHYTIKSSKENFKEQSEEVSLTRTLSAKEEAEANRASAKTIKFDKLNKNPDRYKGEYVKFKGEIVQIMEGSGMTQIRLSVTPTSYGWSASDIIYIAYTGYTDFVDGDVVTVYGTASGSYTYKSQAGWNITLPLIVADFIE